MYLVLDKEVHERNECCEESSTQVFPQLDSSRVRRAQCKTAQRPRQSRDQVADHENIVPIVIIRACNVCPSTACQCPENTHSRNEFRQAAARRVGHAVEEEYQQEAWAGADSDEDLEDGTLRVAVSNGCADRGEPFDGVSEVLVLDNFRVMKGHADNQGAEEGRIGRDGVKVGDPLARYLEGVSFGVAASSRLRELTVATTSPSRCFGAMISGYGQAKEDKGRTRR